MMDTYEKLLAGLSRSGVDYILVGGLAVGMSGYIRATEDVDILIQASNENIRRMLDCLKQFGEGAAAELSVEDLSLEEGAVRVVEDFPLDIFTIMSGHTYELLLPFTLTRVLEGEEIRFLGPEGLLKLKASSLRPKDQQDVVALRELLRKKTGA